MRFTKGHGTGNDFIILPDPDGRLDLTPSLVAALCHRRFGLGADGVLRVVRAAKHPDAVGSAEAAEWFMDYWNADGSFAEMCGNGARVFARYLLRSGLAEIDGAGSARVGGEGSAEAGDDCLPIVTRAGVVRARPTGTDIAVEMRLPRLYGHSVATLRHGPLGGRAASQRSAGDGATEIGPTAPLSLPGTAVDCGNPHLVCVLPADVELAGLDLTEQPDVPAAKFPSGVNVEFVTPVTAPGPGAADIQVGMRVFERGSGETLSCGTGACAVAAVALADAGLARGVVAVDVPGGRLTVTFDGRACWLAGPAVLVADGQVDVGSLAFPG